MKKSSNRGRKEKPPFKVHTVEPDNLTPADFVENFDAAMVALKKLEKQQRGKRKVELRVNHSDPIELILAGDFHIGSFATNKEMVDELRDYLLATQNAVLVLLGDEIEGFKARYASTNLANTVPGLSNQLDYFYYSFFKPLADAGKIAAIVSGYWGHNGWTHDDTTLNIWTVLTRHNEKIPLVANGGIIRIRFKNRKWTEVQVHHNPPGSSQIDPVHGLRKTAMKQNPSNRPDTYAAGHIHRAMVAVEHHPGTKKPINMVQAGTAKSSEEGDNTDPFGEKLGLGPADKLRQGSILRPPKGRSGRRGYVSEVQFPYIQGRQGTLVLAALELLNQAERTKSTDDVLGQIKERFPAPTTTYIPNRSRISASPADQIRGMRRDLSSKNGDTLNQGDIRPLYETLTYEVASQLPITVHPIAHARLGSWHERAEVLPVEQYVQQIAEDRYSFAIFLRSILDTDAAKQKTRLELLQRYIDMVNVLDGRVLGIMLDTGLGNKKWLKRLGDEFDLRPLAAGSYLSSETGARLVHHMSTVNMAVGPQHGFDNKAQYPIQVVDKLLRHGSFSSTKGINRIYWLYSADRPSVMVGGHTPVAGVSQFFDRTNLYTDTPTTIIPGWWSKFVDTTGSRSKGGEPGQAAILLPANGRDDAMVIPTASVEQTQVLSQALTLKMGAELLGIDRKLQPSRRGRRR